MELRDKVAIVTGAGGGGCGRAVARRFAQEGASVVVNEVVEAGGRQTVRLIETDGGTAAFIEGDVGDENTVRAMIAFAESHFGGLDVLVNNASAPYPKQGELTGWSDAVRVDLLGPMYVTLHAVEAMRRRGGAVVNVGSTSALGHGLDHSKSPSYDVSKAGVIRLTTTLRELGLRENIRVNYLVPTWIASAEVKEYWNGLTAQQRTQMGVPDSLLPLAEIADAVVRLATDQTLAGRVMVSFNGQAPRLIPVGYPD